MSARDLVSADNVGVLTVKLIVRSVAAKNNILWHDLHFRVVLLQQPSCPETNQLSLFTL